MQKYRFLKHTADIKFQAIGNSLEECFKNAGYALVNIICKDKIREVKDKKIKIKAKDMESLLYDFLEELLYLIDTEDFLLSKIKNIKITGVLGRVNKRTGKSYRDYELVAEISGDNLKKYKAEKDVKAVTYNDMFVVKEGNIYKCQVIVDV